MGYECYFDGVFLWRAIICGVVQTENAVGCMLMSTCESMIIACSPVAEFKSVDCTLFLQH